MLAFYGVMSAVLSTFAYIPYIKDTLARRTQPDRASWLIWSTLGSIAFFSQLYEGATDSLWFAGVQVSGTIIVFFLSIKLGAGDYLSKKNLVIFFIAACGLVAWYFTETAVYALAITISISLLGGSVTVQKAYENPETETMSTWAVSLLASACAVLSVGEANWVILAYPLYLLTLYGAIVTAMILGRTHRPAVTTITNDSPALHRSEQPISLEPLRRAVLDSLRQAVADADRASNTSVKATPRPEASIDAGTVATELSESISET